MTWIAPDVARTQVPLVADERTMLDGWLDRHRQTLLWKCRGLTAEQLKLASAEPSTLTLLGLVRHMAELPLDHTFVHARRQQEMSLRWVYVHMIEEYARHNGHADLIRERIDRVTGD